MSRLIEENANLLGEERLNHLIGHLEEKNTDYWYRCDPQVISVHSGLPNRTGRSRRRLNTSTIDYRHSASKGLDLITTH